MGPRIISSLKNVTLSNEPIQKLIFQSLKKHGDKSHLIEYETGTTSTFSQLLDDSVKLSAEMLKLNVAPGDVVMVYGCNSYEFLLTIISGMFIGATIMPMKSGDSQHALKNQANLHLVKHMFVDVEFREIAVFMEREVPLLRNVILIESENDTSFPTIRQLINNCENVLSEDFIVDPKHGNEIAIFLQTSGTSGPQKAVKIGNYDLATMITNVLLTIPAMENEVDFVYTNINQVSGISVHLRAILAGVKVLNIRSFEATRLLDGIQKHRVTVALLTPYYIQLLNEVREQFDVGSMQLVVTSGARATLKLITEFREKYSIPNIFMIYSMTESYVSVTSGNCDGFSIGRVCPGIQIKIINPETGELLGENEQGEICFKGPLKFKGYHQNEEATKALIDANGWIHSGDIGYFDEEEKFYIVDRSKDIILQNGTLFSPADVEFVLLEHWAVKEAAVVGIPYQDDFHVAHAFVVLKDDLNEESVSKKDLLQFVNERLSEQRQLKSDVHFVSEIPRNNLGKILRRKLREDFLTSLCSQEHVKNY